MTDKEKDSLRDAIIYTSCGKLPDENDPKKVWVIAILRVQKITSRFSYILAKHCYEGGKDSFYTIKDFGEPARISRVDKIYPLEYADVPKFKTKDDVLSYLCKGYGKDKDFFESIDDEHKEIALKQLLITNYLNKRNGQKRTK